MKAIVIDEALADRPLRYEDVPAPVCGKSDLLIPQLPQNWAYIFGVH